MGYEPRLSRVAHSPFGGLSAGILFFTLNLLPQRGKTVREHLREFDFLGLLLVAGGVVCLLIGFNNSEVSCMFCHLSLSHALLICSYYIGSSAETIALLTVGGCLLVAFAANELVTQRAPIVAPRLFRVCPSRYLCVSGGH
jgi:hypothetical protein